MSCYLHLVCEDITHQGCRVFLPAGLHYTEQEINGKNSKSSLEPKQLIGSRDLSNIYISDNPSKIVIKNVLLFRKKTYTCVETCMPNFLLQYVPTAHEYHFLQNNIFFISPVFFF